MSSTEVRGVGFGEQQNKRNKGFLAVAKTLSMNLISVKDMPDSKAIKDWKMTITIYHTNMRMSWGEVTRKLESIIKKEVRSLSSGH